jgi:N-hydroxyarylamine O-acetyltransferase
VAGPRRLRQLQPPSAAARLGFFEPTCWWHQTSPASHFTRSLVCSLLTDDGRITLKDQTLIETTPTGRREHTLPGDAEVLDAYRTCFGIALDHLPSPRTPGSRPG